MPPKVASSGRKSLPGKFKSRLHESYPVSMSEQAKEAQLEKFWSVSDNVLNLAERLASKVPSSGKELVKIAQDEGCEDMFPSLSREEKAKIAEDGKIPVYSTWEKMIKENKIAPDTLLNLAGLASFTADQNMLDERIKGIIG